QQCGVLCRAAGMAYDPRIWALELDNTKCGNALKIESHQDHLYIDLKKPTFPIVWGETSARIQE
ncbi:hypothetical protein, partial [Planococcus soli]|uniref:hypothetical protein n=1 Tax=Planococcus soli TaxID=2666072 RepID=UPI001C8F91D6